MTDRLMAWMKWLKAGAIEDDFDYVIAVDGPEGGGKSTWAMHAKAMYDGRYNLDYVIYDSSDLYDLMRTAPKGSAIILDEAVTSFMSRTSLDRFQVRLVQAFSIVREKNLLFFLLIPNLQLLDKALQTRAKYRVWVYNRGRTRGFSTIYYAERTPWTKGRPWHEEAWHYDFPMLPEGILRRYKKFKSSELDRKLQEYKEADEEEERRIQERRKKVIGVKTQMIIDYINEHPQAEDKEIAREVGCSMDWVKKTAPVYRPEPERE